MISIAVVDSSAESRNSIIEELNECFYSDSFQLNFLPRIHITPLAPEEIKFHKIPDICILGPRLLLHDVNEIARIKRLLPNSALLVRATGMLESISMTEHLARLGADDILPDHMLPSELLRKLILHARSADRTRSGKFIVVDSGKGGLGVTSVAAALGDCCARAGRRTLLVDLDFDTQDLSRFLQARPCINETLGALLSQQKPIVQELVEECVHQVWSDDTGLFIMPPAASAFESLSSGDATLRSFVSVFEILDSLFDVLIIDAGNTPQAMRKTLWRMADHLLLVGSNDPATLFASIERTMDAYASLAPAAKLSLIFNGTKPWGVPLPLMKSELVRATQLDASHFLEIALPLSKGASLWPGSGGTPGSQGDRGFRRALQKLVSQLGILDGPSVPASTLEPAQQAAAPRPSATTQALPEPRRIEYLPQHKATLPASTPAAAPKNLRDLVGKAQIFD